MLITRAQIGATAARIQRRKLKSVSLPKPQDRLKQPNGWERVTNKKFVQKSTYIHAHEKNARARTYGKEAEKMETLAGALRLTSLEDTNTLDRAAPHR